MKKQIISAVVLAGMVIGSTSAFASRARQNVMGTDATGIVNAGAMHYDTMYNIFYNPAYVNDFKNWAIIEKGAAGAAGLTNEGGFVASMMNFNVGLFMNRFDAFAKPTNSASPAFATGVRPLDLIVGGDQGVKWGLGLTYANEKGNGAGVGTAGSDQSNLTARAGISINNFDPFVSYRIIGKDKPAGAAPAEVKNKDMTIGLRYHYGEWTPYAAYRTGKSETATAVPAVQGKFTGMLLGVGRDTKLGEGARLVYGVAYGRTASKDLAATTPVSKSTATIMPINMALEGDVASWITLRAGMRYDLMNKLSGNTVAASTGGGTQAGTVSARIGATIHANKFDFDWAFGQGTAAGNTDTDTFGIDGGTFTNASLSYKW